MWLQHFLGDRSESITAYWKQPSRAPKGPVHWARLDATQPEAGPAVVGHQLVHWAMAREPSQHPARKCCGSIPEGIQYSFGIDGHKNTQQHWQVFAIHSQERACGCSLSSAILIGVNSFGGICTPTSIPKFSGSWLCGCKKMWQFAKKNPTRIFVSGTNEKCDARDSFKTSNGSCASAVSQMYFLTNRMTSPSEAGSLDEPELIDRANGAGTSSGFIH